MKSAIKKIIPNTVENKIKLIRSNIELNKLTKNDKKRFQKYSSQRSDTDDFNNMRSKVMYYTHQLEKGLSRKNFRYGFGVSAITSLVESLVRMKSYPEWRDDDFYRNGISALAAYQAKHQTRKSEIPNFDILTKEILEEVEKCKDVTAGIIEYTLEEKKENEHLNFKELAMNRYSIRDFNQSATIKMEDLYEAIEISTKSPSVCNRQPSRVKIVVNKNVITKVLELQGGFGGYDLPDKLIIITSDLAVFLRSQERNQSYIDGGLFSMSLLYALEYKGIGACPLSTNIPEEKNNKIREILKIPDNEILIMFIVCGIMENKVKCPKSYRMPSNEITQVIR